MSGNDPTAGLRSADALPEALGSGIITDAVIAQSKQQREDLWDIRDDIEGLGKSLFQPIVFDVSLGIEKMDGYVKAVRGKLKARWPDSQRVAFGHIGDGNIHLVVTVGSLEKREYLKYSRSEVEISLMKTMKQALDPKLILNPGKIF